MSINEILINDGQPGTIYKLLLKLWNKHVRLDIKEQIQRWDRSNNKLKGISPYQFGENNNE